MYCMKGKWRVYGKTRSPEFSPVYSRVASALPLLFFFLQGEAFASALWALLSSAWAFCSTHTDNSVLTPAPNPLCYSGESSATPGPLILLGKVKWRDRRRSTIAAAVAVINYSWQDL